MKSGNLCLNDVYKQRELLLGNGSWMKVLLTGALALDLYGCCILSLSLSATPGSLKRKAQINSQVLITCSSSRDPK